MTVHDSARLFALGPDGIGLSSASWIAYRVRKGLIEPSVSAGSSQRGARVKCTAQVIWPAGAGPPVCADPTAARHVCNAMTTSTPMSRRMGGPPGRAEGPMI